MPFSIYHSQGPTYHGKLDAQGKTPCYKQLPDGHATVEVGQPRDLDQKIQSQRQQLKKVLHQIIQKTRQHYDQHDHDSTLLHRLGQYAQGFKQGVEDLAVSTWHATETVGHVFQNTAVTDFQIAQWLATGDEAVQHKLAQKGETITHTLQHLSGDAQQGYHLLKLLMTDHDTRQLLIQFLKQYWAALPEDQQMQDIGEVVGNLGGVGILLGILGKVARFTPKALPTSAHSAMNQAAQKANKLAELLKQRQQAKKLNKAELNKKHHLQHAERPEAVDAGAIYEPDQKKWPYPGNEKQEFKHPAGEKHNLPYEINETFSGKPKPKILPSGTKIYRIISDTNNPNGAFWLYNLPDSEEAWRDLFAVKNKWNSNGYYVKYEVGSEGLPVWEGNAATQSFAIEGDNRWIRRGGGQQLFIPSSREVIPYNLERKTTPWRTNNAGT